MFDVFFFCFFLNIECEYTKEPPRRGGYNEYPQSIFGAKIRKIDIPLHTPFCYIKVGYEWVYISRTCFPDAYVFA